MNYYNEIKEQLVSNEIYKKVKDYSKNKNDLMTYYNVGKLLSEAGKHYGENIIEQYSRKLTIEIGKNYSTRVLYKMIKYYEYVSTQKMPTVSAKLSWSHYDELLKFNDTDKINYYTIICYEQNLSIRELREKIKNQEYERLDKKTKEKLLNNNILEIQDLVKNPIILKNTLDKDIKNEKALKLLILENMEEFLTELGNGFCFIKSEYKIKIGNNYNYIDLLLYNIKYKCYVVIELKVTELKKEHIGQIMTYMNYINENIKTTEENKTIGIIITKKDNRFIMQYCSDNNIFNTTYKLQNI